MPTKRTRRQTPGVLANNEPAAVAERMRLTRLRRRRVAQDAGFPTADKLAAVVFEALSSKPQQGHQLLDAKRPCQKCGRQTDIANIYELQGWLLLQPICIKCSANRGA